MPESRSACRSRMSGDGERGLRQRLLILRPPKWPSSRRSASLRADKSRSTFAAGVTASERFFTGSWPILSRNALSLNSMGSVDRTHSKYPLLLASIRSSGRLASSPTPKTSVCGRRPARACAIRAAYQAASLPVLNVPSVAPPSLISMRYVRRGLSARERRSAPAAGPSRRECGCCG